MSKQMSQEDRRVWYACWCAVLVLCLLAWVMPAQAQVPSSLLSKLKRLQQSKKIYQQNMRRHAGLQQKYARMVRLHKSEMTRYSGMQKLATTDIKKTYIALSGHHKAIALRYARMSHDAQSRAKRDKRNARRHQTQAIQYQGISKKHAQLAHDYLKKSGNYKFDAKVDQLRKQKKLKFQVQRPHLGNIRRIRPHVLAPPTRR